VRLMVTAMRAKLLELETVGGSLLVLHLAVVPVLAFGALERDYFASHWFLSLPLFQPTI
jgi:hypothetical protein